EHSALLSFPTRRSSDLGNAGAQLVVSGNVDLANRSLTTETVGNVIVSGIISGTGGILKTNSGTLSLSGNSTNTITLPTVSVVKRSEEHTSELQSPYDLV